MILGFFREWLTLSIKHDSGKSVRRSIEVGGLMHVGGDDSKIGSEAELI